MEGKAIFVNAGGGFESEDVVMEGKAIFVNAGGGFESVE